MTTDQTARGAARPTRRPPQVPRTADISGIDLDILGGLLSFYIRVINLVLGRDLDGRMRGTPVARGTGKISTLLLVAANPGIRPSVIAHFNMKDRSAMVRILGQLRRAGLLRQSVSATERRAHELHLTPKGHAVVAEVRAIATRQSDAFFAMLSPEERRVLGGILDKVYRSVIGETGPAG
jgi:DNA-binding MarR family transcriptional regulator